jgi:hypothetical protein
MALYMDKQQTTSDRRGASGISKCSCECALALCAVHRSIQNRQVYKHTQGTMTGPGQGGRVSTPYRFNLYAPAKEARDPGQTRTNARSTSSGPAERFCVAPRSCRCFRAPLFVWPRLFRGSALPRCGGGNHVTKSDGKAHALWTLRPNAFRAVRLGTPPRHARSPPRPLSSPLLPTRLGLEEPPPRGPTAGILLAEASLSHITEEPPTF